MKRVVIDPGQNAFWENRSCQQCGKEFMVRRCYTKRGQGKFCSTACGTRFRNLHDNPSKRPEVRLRISENHARISGPNHYMFGKRGADTPGYIDGRNSIAGDIWRKIALVHKPPRCEICDVYAKGRNLHIHHKDGNRNNNDLDNLQVVCVKCHNTILHEHPRDNLGRYMSKEVMPYA